MKVGHPDWTEPRREGSFIGLLSLETLSFRLYPLRFSFVALESIHFPTDKAANLLRGAFGTIFARMACVPHCPGARECEWRATCPYARLFEPSVLGGPSGFADKPRPFVFRATHLDNRTVPSGSSFRFDLNLFDLRSPVVAYLALSFAQLASEGLGPGRGRAALTEVSQVDENGEPVARIYDSESRILREAAPPMELSLEPATERVGRMCVRFVTPTELKSGQQVAERPEFGILAARIRDRLSTLRELYDGGPLPIDFRAFAERASRVRMTRCEIEQVSVIRRSSRTGRAHPIGGFIGQAEYEGDLAEFIPYLKAAKWTGVGRQTVWGKGELDVETSGTSVAAKAPALY